MHDQLRIPVVMYHSVGLEKSNWLWSHISIPVSLFEAHLSILKKNKFRTIDLSEYFQIIDQRKQDKEKLIVLTFDDGYLDNWVYAYPLLKKYRMKATIFVNPEFIDPQREARPNLENVWHGSIQTDQLIRAGFLNWNELFQMEKSGVIDIQSHSMTHTWHFCGEKMVDFHHPNDPYPWLAWNERPQTKHQYLTENQENIVPYGTPVYENGRALGVRRFFPDKKLDELVVEYVAQHKGEEFFKNPDWRDRLFQLVENHKLSDPLEGRFEMPEEFESRLSYELFESKLILEKKLNKQVKFLCCPGGAYTSDVLKRAKQFGYEAMTYSSKSSVTPDSPGDEYPRWIVRMGCASPLFFKQQFVCHTSASYFMASIHHFQNRKFSLWILRWHKLTYLFCHFCVRLWRRIFIKLH
ncbi:MAG: polysaccharide deacetylase family protein [bacterium]|jgi:peptidoglycan/xylan/chitin deacetylase (PgdA/CDA1 family)|nr:polysaccharide deacetylase family protein [bacterium]